MFGGSKKAAPKKAVKKVVKKVAPKKVVKKVAKKSGQKFSPGKQMPANQAVMELFGGVANAFNLLKNLPK